MSQIGSIETVSLDYPMSDNGLLECQGQSLLISDYPDLYAKIGHRYGGDDTTFNTPTYESGDLKFGIVFKLIQAPPVAPGDEVHVTPENRQVNLIIQKAKAFGDNLMVSFTTENILLGVTQAGKTKAVADYMKNLQFYLSTCSLYAAITEINNMLNDGLPEDLAPFITVDRLNTYKTKIQVYLGIA